MFRVKSLTILPSLLLSSLLLSSLLLSGSLLAEPSGYMDLIDLPALQVETSRYALTLDVTHAGDRLVTVGERGHILFSDDQGESWSQAAVDSRAHLNAVTFTDEKIGWAVGEDAVILNTVDGGETWQRQFDAREADLKGPLLDVWFRNAREGFAVGVFNKVYRTMDGGRTWVNWYDQVDNLDEWHLFAIASVGDDTIYITSEQGLIFRSTDGGESFLPLQTDHYGSFHGILAFRGENGLDTLVLSGVGGIVYTSRDGGETWSRLETGTNTGLSGSTRLPGGGIIVVGYGGMVLHIDEQLQNVSLFPQENGLPLSSIETVGTTQKIVLVGFGGPQAVELPVNSSH